MVNAAPGAAGRPRQLASWLAIGTLMAVVSTRVLVHEGTAFDQQVPKWTGADFGNNTWRAVRGLLAGQNVYAAGGQIPVVGPVQRVAEHVPATLTWGAPFAALPLRPALLAFAAASLLAIWAGVFILGRPRSGPAAMVAVCCGAFAILIGGGPATLLLGQPTGFALLGLAVVVRARRPWVAALGFMLAASTIQSGLPLALALIVLGQWPKVWRGLVMTLTWSLPPMVIGIVRVGPGIIRTFVSGASNFLGLPPTYRIDLGALVDRAGVQSTAADVGIGLSVLALALLFLAHLPAELRRIDYPPVLCLVIAVTLLCTYHQPYDVLLVSGAIIPVSIMGTRSVSMLPIFGLAGISAGSLSKPVGLIVVPVGLLAIAVLSAAAARRWSALDGMDASVPTRIDFQTAPEAVTDGSWASRSRPPRATGRH